MPAFGSFECAKEGSRKREAMAKEAGLAGGEMTDLTEVKKVDSAGREEGLIGLERDVYY
jgi:hypothetical protein